MIKLTKDKIIWSNHFNSECDEYVERDVALLYPYLNERVVLSEDFTFGDLFNHLDKDRPEFDLIFSSCLGHHSLQLWFDEIRKPGSEKDDEIDYLEIYRWGEYWSWGNIDLSIGISGISSNVEYTYGIGFTPLNELKHLPLRLNENFGISEVKIPPRIIMFCARMLKKLGIPVGKWNNPFEHTYVKGKAEFTVYELITAVLYEISFYGDPEKRDEKMEELERITKESMEMYDDHPEGFSKFGEEE